MAHVPMATWLMNQGVVDAEVVPVSGYEWLLTSLGFGWRRVLYRVTRLCSVFRRITRWVGDLDRSQLCRGYVAALPQ